MYLNVVVDEIYVCDVFIRSKNKLSFAKIKIRPRKSSNNI